MAHLTGAIQQFEYQPQFICTVNLVYAGEVKNEAGNESIVDKIGNNLNRLFSTD